MNRRPLALMLIGAIATLLALWMVVMLRAAACTDAGGRWDEVGRACVLPEGVNAAAASVGVAGYLLAVLVGTGVGVALWWVYRRAAGRRARRTETTGTGGRGLGVG